MQDGNELESFQRRRIAALWIFTGLIALALLFTRSAWADGPRRFGAAELIVLAGLALIAVGIAIRLWATLYIGGRKSSSLVRQGPYSITRNPLYVGSIVAAGGVGAQTGSLIVAVVTALVATAVFWFTILREEGYLEGVYGAEFRSYCAAVPRLWPSLSHYAEESTLSVDTSRLYRTLRDGLWFFVAFPAFGAIEWLQQAGFIPVLFRLY